MEGGVGEERIRGFISVVRGCGEFNSGGRIKAERGGGSLTDYIGGRKGS